MARVVQQRSGLLYLLVAFVFLFLISTTLAVLFYTKYDNVAAEKDRDARAAESLATPVQLKWPRIAKIQDDFEKGGRGAQTVVSKLVKENEELAQAVVGDVTTHEIALAKAKDAFRKIGGPERGLVVEVEALLEKVQAAEARNAQIESDLKSKDDDLRRLEKNVKEVTERLGEEIASLKGQIGRIDEQLKAEQRAYVEKLNVLSQQYDDTLAQRDNRITDFVGEVENLQLEGAKLKQRVAMLQESLRQIKAPRSRVEVPPDGEIMRVVADEGICYVNIGSKDGLRPGVSFAVYPKTGTAEDMRNKGSLVVVDVLDAVSKCRIARAVKDRPIVAGDLISNVAFDRVRTYKFMVEGQFDLYGRGVATSEDAKVVKMLIQQYGGKLTDKLDPVATDFVVLGEEPVKPSQPEEGTSPASSWALYRDQMQAYQRYEETVLRAQQLNIPRLNTNEFIALTGYVAELPPK